MKSNHTDCVSALSRRDFLKRGGAGLAAAALLPASASAKPAAPAIARRQTDLVFTFGPDDSGTLQTLIDDSQQRVNGEVRVKLYKGNVTIVGRRSETDSLFDEDIATFEEDDTAHTRRTVSIKHPVSDVPPTVTITGAATVNGSGRPGASGGRAGASSAVVQA